MSQDGFTGDNGFGVDDSRLDAASYAALSRGRGGDEIREELKRLAEDKGEDVVEFLAQLALTSDPKLSLAAVEALGRIRDKAAADALSLLAGRTESKEIRKRARAMLFQLHSWGIEPSRVEEEAPPQEEKMAGARPEFLDGRVTFLDHSGHRIISALVKEIAGLQHIWFVSEDGVGIEDASVERTSKRGYDRWTEDLSSYRLPIIPATVDHVDFFIRESSPKDEAGKGSLPARVARAIAAWNSIVAGRKPKYSRHPIYYEFDEQEVGHDRGALAEAEELISLDETRDWVALVPNARDYNRRAYSVIHTVIQVAPGVRGEMIARIVGEAAEEAFGGDRRYTLARRLEDLAYFLLQGGRQGEARQAFAVALALRRGDSLIRIPFVESLVLHAIGLKRVSEPDEVGDEEDREEDIPLIINPFDPRYRERGP
ncbi:MAG TPA: hypothetical protein GX506_10810 [Firmicutes bacterium]|nr:hypothetical protein [Bacillota bacterium]